MSLTEIGIRAITPAEKITRHYDDGGLYIEVSPAGGKWWRFKYRLDGKEKRISLGVWPEVSLKKAREMRDAARMRLRDGVDPGALRRQDRDAVVGESFEAVARVWLKTWRVGKTERHADYVTRRLEADVFPELGALAIQGITARQVVTCVKKIEARGAVDLAKKKLITINQIFRYAVAHGLAERNPAADVRPSDILPQTKKKNYARIDARDLPKLMRDINGYRDEFRGGGLTRLAMLLMAHTFVRTRELIEARWGEFDKEFWRIPAERMKMDGPHIVPLSRQALALLDELRAVTGEGVFLFPGKHENQTMSNNTILYALYRMGYRSRMTGHGFRGLASTVLHEQGWPHEHIELQLAHVERNAVSAAYNHALYLAQRSEMMQAWSDFIDTAQASV